MTILNAIRQEFECKEVDIRAYSPLTLAYIGDAIYDLIIRTIVVERANRPANKLHKTVVRYVNAGTQAQMIMALEEELTEEEKAVYHRGRNAIRDHGKKRHDVRLPESDRFGSAVRLPISAGGDGQAAHVSPSGF